MPNIKNPADLESERLLKVDWQGNDTAAPKAPADKRIPSNAAAIQRNPGAELIAEANAAAAAAEEAALAEAAAALADAECDEAADAAFDADAIQQTVATASLRIDEVFNHISAYRAIVENRLPGDSLLARSLRAQANAIFNQAFLNLQARYGYAEIFIDSPVSGGNAAGLEDITAIATHEVLRLQGILK